MCGTCDACLKPVEQSNFQNRMKSDLGISMTEVASHAWRKFFFCKRSLFFLSFREDYQNP
jgi:hypothetical protein